MTDAPIIAKPEDINAELASRAFNGTSFDPEKRGQSRREGYAADVNNLYAEMWPLAKTDQQKELLAHEMATYKDSYIRHLNAYLQSHSNVVSSMIAGPSNFPVRQMQKRGQWADNRANELVEWQTKAKAAIKRKLLDARPDEEKANAEWRALERDINGSLAVIHAIDTGQSPYTRSAFTNSISGKIERLALAGETELVTKATALLARYCGDHEKPCFTARHKVWTFLTLAEQAAQKHDAALDKEPEVIGKAEGVEIIANSQADRVQIVFAAKPSVEMIGKLKAEAWNWSRTEGAWQRRITAAAKESALRITGASK